MYNGVTKSYFASTSFMPVEGKPMNEILRLEGTTIRGFNHTFIVIHIEVISSDVYKVYTKNTLYIVKVLAESSVRKTPFSI